jgi:curved DNA-binding protein CbpA
MKLFTNNIVRKFATSFKKDPYEMLGLTSKATEEDIKSAYYTLAKQFHPDVNTSHTEKFKEISEAYNILKDPTMVNLDLRLEG